MVKREHRHFLFMKLGMCLCPGLSRHINLALDLFALQRLKYYFQFFHEIPLQIERTSISVDLYDKYICHWFNSICFASPLSHYEMLSSCFIIYRNLRSQKYISNNAQCFFSRSRLLIQCENLILIPVTFSVTQFLYLT